MYYAQITNGICSGITETSGAVIAPNMVEVQEFDISLIGRAYANGAFAPKLTPLKRIGTHLWFREHFTQAERENIDELEATFESNALLTAAQKKQLRTGFKDYNMGTDVNKDDPRIPPMLGLFVALGLLAANRPSEILA